MNEFSGVTQPLSRYWPDHIWSTVITSASDVLATKEETSRACSASYDRLSNSTLTPLSFSYSGSSALMAKKKGSSTDSTRTALAPCASAGAGKLDRPVAAAIVAPDPTLKSVRLEIRASLAGFIWFPPL